MNSLLRDWWTEVIEDLIYRSAPGLGVLATNSGMLYEQKGHFTFFNSV